MAGEIPCRCTIQLILLLVGIIVFVEQFTKTIKDSIRKTDHLCTNNYIQSLCLLNIILRLRMSQIQQFSFEDHLPIKLNGCTQNMSITSSNNRSRNLCQMYQDFPQIDKIIKIQYRGQKEYCILETVFSLNKAVISYSYLKLSWWYLDG